jgi:hypothetical protein
MLKQWVASRRFKGSLHLTDGNGSIALDVKVEFPSFLVVEVN